VDEASHHEPGAGREEATDLRRCVYTVLTGAYERLNEQPLAAESGIPFICLTDDPQLTSDSWEIRVIEPAHPGDAVRSQRVAKARCHTYLPEFDASLYIDNTVVLTAPPERVFARYFVPSGFVVPRHPARDTVLDEFAVIAALGTDDPEVVFAQLEDYIDRCPDALDERCTMTCILLRDHRAPGVRLAGDVWAAEMERHSRRDQLSVNVGLRLAGVHAHTLDIDARGSWFHTWPHRTRRRPHRPVIGTPTVTLLLARRILMLSRARRPGAQKFGSVFALPVPASSVTTGGLVTPTGVHVDPNDLRGQQLVLCGGRLIPTAHEMWRALLASGDWTHVVDVGAGYGEMLVDLDLPPEVVVIAAEPSPRVGRYLERTLKTTGREVRIESRALGEHSGPSRLLIDPDWSGRTRLLRDGEQPPAGGLHIAAEVTTLSQLLGGASAAPAVTAAVKIAVEGGEADVLRGADEVLDRLEGFAALVEVEHLVLDDRRWLLDTFRVQVYATRERVFTDVAPATPARLSEMLAAPAYWGMDVVLRRRDD
jgi:FkbM family methyltransferase